MDFVSKLNGNGILPKGLHEDLMIRFDEMYKNKVAEIQMKVDRQHFGFDVNFLRQNKERKVEKEEMKLFIETAMKWSSMMEAEEAMEGEDRCRETGQCPASNRIAFIMDLFSEHFLNQMVYRKEDEEPEESHYLDLFTECLSEYDAVSLLNDYDHIKAEHDRKANDRLRHCQHIGPYTKCSRSLRLLRENMVAADDENLRYYEFAKGLDHRQRVLLEITCKVHSFLNHSIDDDDEEKEEVIPPEMSMKSSKFVNEMDGGTLPQTERTKMDGLKEVMTRCGVSKEERLAVSKWLSAEQFESDSIARDLDTVRRSMKWDDSNLMMRFTQNRYRIMMQMVYHLNALDPFKFGSKLFHHWKWFENEHGFNYVKSPKYSNLKEEC